jgi:hypothetical protein
MTASTVDTPIFVAQRSSVARMGKREVWRLDHRTSTAEVGLGDDQHPAALKMP